MTAKPLIYQFLDVRVEVASFRVTLAGRPVALEPKVIKTLIFLLERRGRLVEKDELLDGVWKDTFVTPNALTRVITKLRSALGDDVRAAHIIETVPTRGYRFIAEVEQWEAEPSNPSDHEAWLPQFIETTPVSGRQPVIDIPRRGDEELLAARRAPFSLEQVEESAACLADQDEPGCEVEVERRVRSEPVARKRTATPYVWLAATVLLASIAVLLYQWRASRDESANELSVKSVAVLPFKLLQANDNDEYLKLGLTDAVITRLSVLPQLTLRPMNAVLKYSGHNGDLATIARELRVDALLDGTVQQAGDRVRVTARLVRAADGQALWAESYDTEFKHVFQVQEAISTSIASALRVRLSEDELERLVKRPTQDLAAYRCYLRGNYHLFRFTLEDTNLAIGFYQQALARDPKFALAYMGLAGAYNFDTLSAINDPQELQTKFQAAVQQALALDPTLAEAHAAVAAHQFWELHNSEAARESFSRAVTLKPNSYLAHHYYGWFLTATGSFEAAKVQLRRALEIDPLTPMINTDQGLPFYYARDFERARVLYEQALTLDESSWYGHERLGEAYEGLGDYTRAGQEFERALALRAPGEVRAQLAGVMARAGKRDEARRLLQELSAAKTPMPYLAYYLALAYVALGEKETAFQWLDRARVTQVRWLGWIKVEPGLDPLREDARFAELVKSIAIAQ